jgi:hypothetical protein
MNLLLKGLGVLVVIAVITSAVLIGSAAWWGTPLDGTVIQFDDARFTLGELTTGHWLLAFVGVLVAILVVLVVVPLAVLLPLAFAAVAVTLSLAFAAAVIALVFSPLLLLMWAVWRLLRGSSRSTAPDTSRDRAPAATIAA